MEADTKDQETYSLNEKEKRILRKTGIPPVFALFLKKISHVLGVSFAFRTHPPMQRYTMPAAPKPLCVKAKTGNWGFTKGVIPVDPALGKTDKIKGHWEVTPRGEHELPPKDQDILQETLHRLSLQEILAGINGGEYVLVGTEEDIQVSGFITVESVRRSPLNAGIVFRINLNEDKSRLDHQCIIDFDKVLVTPPPREPRPYWWLDKWGDFEECHDNYYPAQYKLANFPAFKDIKVYGILDENNNILPITGDQDLLWISIPTKQHEKFLKDFEEVINTFEEGGVEKLYRARVALHIKLGGRAEDAEKSICNSSIAGLGCVTAFESYVIDEVNKSFAHAGVSHIRNLIQHASENHNPEHPLPLDTTFVHVWHKKIILTRDETEIIKFVMHADYPTENIINVHPRWDMSKWSEVIAMQLALKQPVPDITLSAYKDYRHKNRNFSNLLHWVKKKNSTS